MGEVVIYTAWVRRRHVGCGLQGDKSCLGLVYF
jgi:hypothetical protein